MGSLAQIRLTLSAEQAILQVTEDSSFRAFRNKGTKSTRDRGLPEDEEEKNEPEHSSALGQRYPSVLVPHWLTCCTLHTGQPAVDVVTHFAERRLDDGCAQDGGGSSDLRVSMVNKA